MTSPLMTPEELAEKIFREYVKVGTVNAMPFSAMRDLITIYTAQVRAQALREVEIQNAKLLEALRVISQRRDKDFGPNQDKDPRRSQGMVKGQKKAFNWCANVADEAILSLIPQEGK